MRDFLDNAGRIFETASATGGAGLPSGSVSILIGPDGAVRMILDSDWPLASLEAHHGARAAYRVSRTATQLRVEGKSRDASCLLESEPAPAIARRLLADRPRYVLTS